MTAAGRGGEGVLLEGQSGVRGSARGWLQDGSSRVANSTARLHALVSRRAGGREVRGRRGRPRAMKGRTSVDSFIG